MSWARFDDQADGDKLALAVADVGDAAAAMWFRAIVHCSKNLTDGFVDARFLSKLTVHKDPKKIAEALVNAIVRPGGKGLFERTDGGYLVHDYLDYNPSRAEVMADREKAKRRMAARRGSGECGPNGGDGSPSVRPNITRTDHEPTENDGGSSDGVQVPRVRGRAEAGTRAAASRPVPSRPDPESTTAGAREDEPRPRPVDPRVIYDGGLAREVEGHLRAQPALAAAIEGEDGAEDLARQVVLAAYEAGKSPLVAKAIAEAADAAVAKRVANAGELRLLVLRYVRGVRAEASPVTNGRRGRAVPQPGPLDFEIGRAPDPGTDPNPRF